MKISNRTGRPGRDDRGSIPMALLVALVGIALVAMVIPIVLSQTRQTIAVREYTTAVQAADTGITVAAGRIENSLRGHNGSTAYIPVNTEITGSPPQSEMTYRVQVDFYTDNPSGRADTWLASHRATNQYGMQQAQFVLFTAAVTNPAGHAVEQATALRVVPISYLGG